MISSIRSQGAGFVNGLSSRDSKDNKAKKTDEVLATDRVSILSKEIEKGDYEVDTRKTATAVVESLSR